MTQKRRIQKTTTATELTQSNLDTIALEDDATAPVPETSDPGIVAASGRLKRINPLTNIVISLGERRTEQGLELKVYHRIDEKAGYFIAHLGNEADRYAKAGKYFVEEKIGPDKFKNYTIVAETPTVNAGEIPYSPLSKDNVDQFKRALDYRLGKR